MRTICALILLGATAAAQIVRPVQHTNGVVVSPTNFWSADAARARSDLGLGWSALTNTNAATFGTAIGLGTANEVTFATVSASFVAAVSGLNGTAIAPTGIQLNGVAAATTRTNLGLGLPALTNTNNANFLTAIGALGTNGSAAGLTNFPTLNQNTTGTASNITGVIPLANGGTGATNSANVRTNLGLGLPALTNTNNVNLLTALGGLATNGSAAGLTNFPTLNQNTTGTASNVSGVVALANGGTGATNAAAARSNLGLGTAAVEAATAFQPASANLTSLASNNAASLTNFPTLLLRTNGSAAALTSFPASLLTTNGNAAGLTNFPALLLRTNGSAAGLTNFPASVLLTNGSAAALTSFPTLNQNTTGTASNVTGTVAVANGGTGATNVSTARTNLGLPLAALTNANNTNFLNAVLGAEAGNYGLPLVYDEEQGWIKRELRYNAISDWADAVINGAIAAAPEDARNAIGLSLPALTQTSNANFRTAIGFSTNLAGLWTATNTATARTNLGATSVGDAVFTATNAAAGATALGLGTTNSVTFSNLTSKGTLIIASPTVPTATNSTGVKGQIAFTNNFLYICVTSNTWRRIQLGTWE